MTQITIDNTREFARYEFSGATLPTEWNILSQGVSQSVGVADSAMTISAGTSAGAQTVVRCTHKFQIKSYVRFVVQLSQRIANQNVYLEITNEAGTTRSPGGYTRSATTTGPRNQSVNRTSQGQWDPATKTWNNTTTYTGPQGNSADVNRSTTISK